MKTFTIHTLGCKVNQYETQQIRQLLEQSSLRLVGPAQNADIVIVNTCCVTHIASAKSRQAVRKAQRQNRHGAVVVTGCLPLGQADEIKNIGTDVRVVSDKTEITRAVAELLDSRKADESVNYNADKTLYTFSRTKSTVKIKDKSYPPAKHQNLKLPLLNEYKGQCRAFLKIQDGCDGQCTYCIIPKIRTKVCNKNVKNVLAEVKNLVEAGHNEIVLTGVFLGAYGQNTVRRKDWVGGNRDSLSGLLGKIAQVPGLGRVRLSSLEPADVTGKLLDVFSGNRNIMPHLHLPVQSGSEKILKHMRRQYTVAEFVRVVAAVRGRLDRPAITTDIIVGFPGETEGDFEQTIELAKEIGFAKMHVFSFSPRAGTAAAKMQGVVNAEVIKRRSRWLRGLDKELGAEFRGQFVGERVEVLVENTRPGQGRCERYFMVDLGDIEGLTVGQVVSTILR